MLSTIANTLTPHYCISCGDIGTVLCEYCRYNIIYERFDRCILCLTALPLSSNLCKKCRAPYSRAWCVSERHRAVEVLVNDYKFGRVRANSKALAMLLDDVVPNLPADTVVTYITSTSQHIRRRGFDHMKLVAHDFAYRRGLVCRTTLIRKNNKHQLGATKTQRMVNARSTFVADRRSVSSAHYLLLDDVLTTGATLNYASRSLIDAGAKSVDIGVVARQLFDSTI